jgi:hypothetical protein
MLLYYQNLADTATLSASTADPNWPVANLQNPQRVRTWKTLGTQTQEWVVFDLGSAQAITDCILHFNNFDGTETGVQIQGNATNSWGSPSFTANLPFAGFQSLGSIIWNGGANFNAYTAGVTFASQTFRYWRVVFTKANATDIRWIGRVYLGTHYDTTNQGDPDYDGLDVSFEDLSIINKNLHGHLFSEQRNRYHLFNCQSTFVPDAIQSVFRVIYSANGIWFPWFIQIRTTAPYNNWYYVTFKKNLPEKVDGYDGGFYWATALQLEENV